MTDEQMFRGTFTALVTPFRNDEIDRPAFERLIEAQVAGGIAGIVPVGTTGESPTLSHAERRQLIELAVKTARNRCQVIAGTGSNSTRDAIAYTREAEELRADGALLVAPYYNKPSQEGLFRHFAAIAKSTSLPLMLYNIPGRCAVDISADTVVRLAETCPNIVSIKEASGSVDRVSELIQRLPQEFTVLSGDDSLTLAFLAVGASGVVSVASNLFPAEIATLVRQFLDGNLKEARQLHRKFSGLFKDLFIEPNPVPAKTALSWREAIRPECRLPLVEMSPPNEERLRRTMAALEQSRNSS
jgi:4-hydroxy-tetrahydrodipicolinate synthase